MPAVLKHSLAAAFLFTNLAFAGDLSLKSGPARVHLLELFTSEGCSSCPPAEERVSALQNDPALWKQIVPVAFHVDYWDNLGWRDGYASSAYTERQRSYARGWGSDSVYTPEFVLDGSEFRTGKIPESPEPAGVLSVVLDSERVLAIRYQASGDAGNSEWEAHVATLGVGLQTQVRRGENGGRTLHHDFVALSLVDLPLNAAGSAKLKLAASRNGEKALAVWVTQAHHFIPVQAVGGWLK